MKIVILNDGKPLTEAEMLQFKAFIVIILGIIIGTILINLLNIR